MSDLDEFVAWSKKAGHYGYLEAMLANFFMWKAERKKNETRELRKRSMEDA